jgi:hypothetical protein
MLTPCHDRHPPQPHTYTVQIREDGDANIWKCGRCGYSIPWSVGDEAEAYVEGDRLLRAQHRQRIGWMGTSGTDRADHDY